MGNSIPSCVECIDDEVSSREDSVTQKVLASSVHGGTKIDIPTTKETTDDIVYISSKKPLGLTLCDSTTKDGVYVTVIKEGGNAAKLNQPLSIGMLLLELNGVDVKSAGLDQVISMIQSSSSEKKLTLKFGGTSPPNSRLSNNLSNEKGKKTESKENKIATKNETSNASVVDERKDLNKTPDKEPDVAPVKNEQDNLIGDRCDSIKDDEKSDATRDQEPDVSPVKDEDNFNGVRSDGKKDEEKSDKTHEPDVSSANDNQENPNGDRSESIKDDEKSDETRDLERDVTPVSDKQENLGKNIDEPVIEECKKEQDHVLKDVNMTPDNSSLDKTDDCTSPSDDGHSMHTIDMNTPTGDHIVLASSVSSVDNKKLDDDFSKESNESDQSVVTSDNKDNVNDEVDMSSK